MIKNTYLKGLWASVMLIAFTANAQSGEEGVKQTILNLFEGMKKSDTALIRSAFAPSAIMQTTDRQVRREYRFQSFKRSFTVDETIDAETISAKYVNGVLSLNLPKKASVKTSAKQISIQ